jgi:hypothetical protein
MSKKTKKKALKPVKFESQMENSLVEDNLLIQNDETVEKSDMINDKLVVEMVEGLLPNKNIEDGMFYSGKKAGGKKSKKDGASKKKKDKAAGKKKKIKNSKKNK